MLVVGVVIIAAVGVLVAVLATIPFQPVSRFRVERLARRESLPITVDNGEIVIRYLATTRRWRGVCLLLSIVLFALYAVQRGDGLRLDLVPALLGWFVGALIAEWRISGTDTGRRRAASLRPRRARDYVAPSGRWPAVLVEVIGVLTALAGIAEFARRGRGVAWPLVVLLGALVAIAAVTAVVARHVLTRPQPLAAPDIVAADDAVRSRSLHAIVGSALALSGLVLASIISFVSGQFRWFGGGALSPVAALVSMSAPVFGVMIATATSKARSRADVFRAAAP